MSVFVKDNKFFMSDKVAIQHKKLTEEKRRYAEHYHDFVEFAYVIKGNYVHIIDGETYPVKRGDMVIINYNQSHSFYSSGDAEYIEILMKPEYINDALTNQENAFALLNLTEFEHFKKILDTEKRCVSFSAEERPAIEQAIAIIEKEIENKNSGYDLAVKSQLNFLIIMLFRKMSLFSGEERFQGISDELLLYIRKHSAGKLTLSDIAEKCWYNPAYFSRIFKEYTGFTFTEYVDKVRIENASNLILKTDMKIEDICFQVGFSDKSRFYKCFKKFMGITPYKYKKCFRTHQPPDPNHVGKK